MRPKAAILTIGTELLLGKVIDTNGAYLGEVLSSAGFDVNISVSVGDHLREISKWVRILFKEVDLIVTTGGLGPTKDDLTRQGVANALNLPLIFHEELMKGIEAIFSSRGFRMTENNRRQAYLPEGTSPILNPMGTAPGFSYKTDDGKIIVCLPGVPKELRFLVEGSVVPYLRKVFDLGHRTKRTRVLKVCGLGESSVDQKIGDLMKTEGNPFVGVLASPEMIRILITAEGNSEADVGRMIGEVETEIRRRLGPRIFGADEETIEGVVLGRLKERVKFLMVEDEATGGELVRHLLKGFEGAYHSMSCLRISPDLPMSLCQEEAPETVLLRVQLLSKEEGGLKDFKISFFGSGEVKEFNVRLGGPKEDVERRLAVLAMDQLRKWLI